MYFLKYKNEDVAKFDMEVKFDGIRIKNPIILNKDLLPPPIRGNYEIRDFLESRIIPRRRYGFENFIPNVFTKENCTNMNYQLAALSGFMSGFDAYYVTPDKPFVCEYGKETFFIRARIYDEVKDDSIELIINLLYETRDIDIINSVMSSKSMTIPGLYPSCWENGFLIQNVPEKRLPVIDEISSLDYIVSKYEYSGLLKIEVPDKDYYFIGMEQKGDERYKKIKEISAKYGISTFVGDSGSDLIVIF